MILLADANARVGQMSNGEEETPSGACFHETIHSRLEHVVACDLRRLPLGPRPYMDPPEGAGEPSRLHRNISDRLADWHFQQVRSWTEFGLQAHGHLHHNAACLQFRCVIEGSEVLHRVFNPGLQLFGSQEEAWQTQ